MQSINETIELQDLPIQSLEIQPVINQDIANSELNADLDSTYPYQDSFLYRFASIFICTDQNFLLNFASSVFRRIGATSTICLIVILSYMLGAYFLLKTWTFRGFNSKFTKMLDVMSMISVLFNLIILGSMIISQIDSELDNVFDRYRSIVSLAFFLNLIFLFLIITHSIENLNTFDQEFVIIAISIMFFMVLGYYILSKIPDSVFPAMLVVLWGLGFILLFDLNKLTLSKEDE